MSRKDHKNDKRRITLPERMKAIRVALTKEGYLLTAEAFAEHGKRYGIISKEIRAHVRDALKRNR